MSSSAPDPRARRWPKRIAGVAALAILLPIGRYDPYPSKALKEVLFAQVCPTLPASTVSHFVGTEVRAQPAVLSKPRVEVENLFPSISRTDCNYTWSVRCTTPTSLRALTIFVATMPNDQQALSRYSYARELLEQDSRIGNDFQRFQMHGRSAYRLAIEDEILERILDGRFIIDMQYHLCSRSVSGPAAVAAAARLADQLRLAITALPRR